jgi:hypothetical protein
MGDLSYENHEWICQERKESLRDSQNTHSLFLLGSVTVLFRCFDEML